MLFSGRNGCSTFARTCDFLRLVSLSASVNGRGVSEDINKTYSADSCLNWCFYNKKVINLKNNPNGLSHLLLVGMDAGRLVIPIIHIVSLFRCDTESGFGGNSYNLQEMEL